MGAAGRAVMAKIMAHDGAAKALATTLQQRQQTQADDAPFRPGAGLPGASAAEGGEGDRRGVTDVERVDVGGDRDAHLPVGRGQRSS